MIKRYRPIRVNVDGLFYQKGMKGYKDGDYLDLRGCFIASQDKMAMGDSLGNLNDQLEPYLSIDELYDVMLIAKVRD